MPSTNSNPRKLRKAAWVRETCGGWSDMTLWRRLNDEAGGFPRPIYIAKRRYWDETEIFDWLESQREEAA